MHKKDGISWRNFPCLRWTIVIRWEDELYPHIHDITKGKCVLHISITSSLFRGLFNFCNLSMNHSKHLNQHVATGCVYPVYLTPCCKIFFEFSGCFDNVSKFFTVFCFDTVNFDLGYFFLILLNVCFIVLNKLAVGAEHGSCLNILSYRNRQAMLTSHR